MITHVIFDLFPHFPINHTRSETETHAVANCLPILMFATAIIVYVPLHVKMVNVYTQLVAGRQAVMRDIVFTSIFILYFMSACHLNIPVKKDTSLPNQAQRTSLSIRTIIIKLKGLLDLE